MGSTALVKSSDVVSIATLDQGRMDVLRGSICEGHSDLEINFFLEYCRVRGFDPFSKMIYSTIRTNQRGKRTQTFQTGIDGMRSQAETSNKYAGQLGPFWCGDDGKWTDIWLGDDAPVAAKVGVLRTDFKEPIWAIAKWGEYKPAEDWMWRKMPSNQLAKCAEALALRKAFPEKLAGLYSDDEMAQSAPKVVNGNTYLPGDSQFDSGAPEPSHSEGIEHDSTGCAECEKVGVPADLKAILRSGNVFVKDAAGKPLEAVYPLEKPKRRAKKEAVPITGANFKEFLDRMAKAKEAVGDAEYYRILKNHNVKHANEIKALPDQTQTLLEMADCYRMLQAQARKPAETQEPEVVNGLSEANYKTALVPFLNRDAKLVTKIMHDLGFEEGQQPQTNTGRERVINALEDAMPVLHQ